MCSQICSPKVLTNHGTFHIEDAPPAVSLMDCKYSAIVILTLVADRRPYAALCDLTFRQAIKVPLARNHVSLVLRAS
jgi:hypothetical protein